MRSQARRAKPQPKPAKRKAPQPDLRLVSRVRDYVPQNTRAHPDRWEGLDDSGRQP